jgi:zinc transporter
MWSNQLSDRRNRTMSVLADAAAALLPPGLIAGLLGINVGGVSGVDSPAAFWTVVLLVSGLGVLEYIVLLKL